MALPSTPDDLSRQVCDVLIDKGLLKSKPAFIRIDREAMLAGVFWTLGLDGKKLRTVEHQQSLEVLVRQCTEGQVWVQDVVQTLEDMRLESINKERAASTLAAIGEARLQTLRSKPFVSYSGGQATLDSISVMVILSHGTGLMSRLVTLQPPVLTSKAWRSVHVLDACFKKQHPLSCSHAYRFYKDGCLLGESDLLVDGDVVNAVLEDITACLGSAVVGAVEYQ